MAEPVAPWLAALSERDREAVKRSVDDAPPPPQHALDVTRAAGCPVGRAAPFATEHQVSAEGAARLVDREAS